MPASISGNEASGSPGWQATLPTSTARRNSDGLSMPCLRKMSTGRSSRDCSRIASGPWRDPTRKGCVPQSKGIPTTQARAAPDSGERAGGNP